MVLKWLRLSQAWGAQRCPKWELGLIARARRQMALYGRCKNQTRFLRQPIIYPGTWKFEPRKLLCVAVQGLLWALSWLMCLDRLP